MRHILYFVIAFIRSCIDNRGFSKLFIFLKNRLCCGLHQTMIRRLICHLEVTNEMTLRIDSRLNVIGYCKAIFVFHKLCIRISKRKLGQPVILHVLSVFLVLCESFLCFLELSLNLFLGNCSIFKIFVPLISIFDLSQILGTMGIQPADSIVQFIGSEISILGIECLDLAAIDSDKTSLYGTDDLFIELVKYLWKDLDVLFPKIRYGSEIRRKSAKKPPHFNIQAAGFLELP